MKKYTILHCIETGGPGGAETILLKLAAGLDRQRFRSLALLPDDLWLRKKLKQAEISTFHIRPGKSYDPRVLAHAARLVRREKVDLIHSHLPDQNFDACLVARATGRKVIVTYHGVDYLLTNGGGRNKIKLTIVRHSADFAVAVSDYLAQLLAQAGFQPERIVRIYPGIDMNEFTRARAGCLREELGGPEGTKWIGMVANFREGKGFEYFIMAARKVVALNPQTRFVSIGEIDEGTVARLSVLIEQSGLRDHFFFLGFREDIAAILHDLDVFVLPSVSEGFSLATVEAMAAGKPAVVTQSGGPREIIEDGRTGFLVPPADTEALASRICELLGSPQLAAALGRSARQAVVSKFSVARMVEEYENLYERCLSCS